MTTEMATPKVAVQPVKVRARSETTKPSAKGYKLDITHTDTGSEAPNRKIVNHGNLYSLFAVQKPAVNTRCRLRQSIAN